MIDMFAGIAGMIGAVGRRPRFSGGYTYPQPRRSPGTRAKRAWKLRRRTGGGRR